MSIQTHQSQNVTEGYKGQFQETLLHVALKNGHDTVAKFLVTSGANVNAVDKNEV